MTCEIEHVEDSFALLRTLPSASVDFVYTDPPYSAHVQNNLISGTAVKKWIDSGGGGGIPRIELPFAPVEDYGFVLDLVRITRRWAVVFCAVEDLGVIRYICGGQRSSTNPGGAFVRGGLWYKPNSKGQLTKDRPAAAVEGVAILHRPGVKLQWNGRGSYNFWQADSDEFPSEESVYVCNGTRGEEDRHPNQKPEKLCLEQMAKFSNRGELAFDPFCGSARSGQAAAALGRSYLGLDSSSEWVEKARLLVAEAGRFSLSDESCLRLCAAPNPWPKALQASSRPSRKRSSSPTP